MSRRQLPLIRTQTAAERSDDPRLPAQQLDRQWLVLTCACGLEVAAAWINVLLDGLAREGLVVEAALDAQALPVGASARALTARASPFAQVPREGPVALRVLVSDRARSYEGARFVLNLVDPVPARSPREPTPIAAFLRPDRLAGAAALARALAGSLRTAM